MGDIRIGKVSSIDYENGMIRVLYTDRDGAVTKTLPVVTFNDEYKMPQVGQYVLVVHLSNGSEAGYILGTYWNTANVPSKSGKGIYRKEMGFTPGEAYAEYDSEEKRLELHADSVLLSGLKVDIVADTGDIEASTITFTDSGGSLTLAEIREKLCNC